MGVCLALNHAVIRQVVESHGARNARVFGSVLRGQDSDDSDLDILVDPTPETITDGCGRHPGRASTPAWRHCGYAHTQGLARCFQQPGTGGGRGGMRKALRVPDYLYHIVTALIACPLHLRPGSGCIPGQRVGTGCRDLQNRDHRRSGKPYSAHRPMFAAQSADIPWLVMYTMRNRVAHGYDKADLEIVCQTIRRDLPGPRPLILKAQAGWTG